MKFKQFETLVSPQRLLRYQVTCNYNSRKTVRLYKANIRISRAFLSVLSIFEIVLRNKIDQHYKAQFPAVAGQDWLLASVSPGGFLTTQNCAKSGRKINAALAGLGARYTHDKLLAELSFGFWTFLFAGHQYLAGGNTLLAIFPNIPSGFNQGNVYAVLTRINSIRNRVAHHEPICFGANNSIDTNYARTHFKDILDILEWMNINSAELFYGVDGVLKEADYIDRI